MEDRKGPERGRRDAHRPVPMTAAPSANGMYETLDREASVPLYLQLAALLRGRIERGEWRAGQKIPSENELNRLYGVSRMTARQVLAQLVNEHLLYRVQGKGTFVAEPKISTRSPAYMGIREQLEGLGYAIATRVLTNALVPADDRVARVLRIMPGQRVHEIRRVRLLSGGEPISLHVSYVPERLAPTMDDGDLVDRQLCEILESDHSLAMSKVSETLESTLATPQEAKDLEITRRTPLLLLTHEIADPTGRTFEYSRILFRGDKIRLQFHYDL
jgi:GntR family transcriptional regulator